MHSRIILLWLLFLPFIYKSQPKDSWSEAGSTNYSRWRHTATLLANGEVLVCGGYPPEDTILAYSSCELYNPEKNKWENVPPMNIARFFHAAVLLNDGRVLVTGGATEDSTTASCEIYNPVNNTWEIVASMNRKRERHLMIKLVDGRVLVAGGGAFDMVSGEVTNTCEIYDPVMNKWEYISPMNYPMINHKGIVLNNGNIFIAGSNPFMDGGNAHYEILNINNLNWDTIPSPYYNHGSFPSLSTLNDEKILVIGKTNIGEVFNPENNLWTVTDSLSFQDRYYAISINKKNVLVLGNGNDCEIYDYLSNSFFKAADKPAYQKEFTLTKLSNGSLLLVGGVNSSGITNKCFIYTPDSTITNINLNYYHNHSFVLYQNYPNPFNPSTTIKYAIPAINNRKATKVKLVVYDLLGREVATLVNGEKSPGYYQVNFDASGLPSGLYFYKLTAGNYSAVKKMILMK